MSNAPIRPSNRLLKSPRGEGGNFLAGLTWVQRQNLIGWLADFFFVKKDFIGWYIVPGYFRVPSHLTIYSWQSVYLCYNVWFRPHLMFNVMTALPLLFHKNDISTIWTLNYFEKKRWQCRPRSMSPYDDTVARWVTIYIGMHCLCFIDQWISEISLTFQNMLYGITCYL